MKSLKLTLFYGFLLWLIPFIIAFAIFPLRQAGNPLFETIMPVTLTISVVIFSVLYYRRMESGYLSEGVKLGVVWFAISFIIDLFMTSGGPMQMSFVAYLKDIGLTYLIYPAVTIGFGFILEKKYA